MGGRKGVSKERKRKALAKRENNKRKMSSCREGRKGEQRNHGRGGKMRTERMEWMIGRRQETGGEQGRVEGSRRGESLGRKE